MFDYKNPNAFDCQFKLSRSPDGKWVKKIEFTGEIDLGEFDGEFVVTNPKLNWDEMKGIVYSRLFTVIEKEVSIRSFPMPGAGYWSYTDQDDLANMNESCEKRRKIMNTSDLNDMSDVESSVEAEMCDFMTNLSDIEHYSDAAFLAALRTLMWGVYTAFPKQADEWIVECYELTKERMK